MPSKSILANLGVLIKAKRREEGVGLRRAAEESGVSASTLSRIESGKSSSIPDTETLRCLSEWLNVSISDFVNERKYNNRTKSPKLETTEQIEAYLRADKNLSTESAKALANAFNELYKLYSTIPDESSKAIKGKKTSGK